MEKKKRSQSKPASTKPASPRPKPNSPRQASKATRATPSGVVAKVKVPTKSAGPLTPAQMRKLEAARRAAKRQMRDELKQRIAEYKLAIKPPISAKAKARKGGPVTPPPISMAGGLSRPFRIIAEGDSWFHYPVPFKGGGIPAFITRKTDVHILNLAHYGEEVRQMLGVEQRRILEQILADDATRPDALLFSGGGNDLVGDQFCLWLNQRGGSDEPAAAINTLILDHVFAVVRKGYQDLISMRDTLAPLCHIFVHPYDFPMPSNVGVCGIGPWLKPSLDYRGWTDPDVQFEVVKLLLTRFRELLEQLIAQNPGAPNRGEITLVNTHGTLDPKPASKHWGNEIHPSPAGFGLIADKWIGALKGRFPTIF